ncbi:cytochrome c oxidase subunit 3 family protein [Pseudonocardia spinosispora]|uniref:cytochrome c oxidase subunit 3 family protein n=1 Tax=Pseudonocardia spinosispora TaxID=103441 RepID=UPI0003F5630C|nr:cytochrome c oxidase subunit 3 family protein [Pseudonocardia spinosispora]
MTNDVSSRSADSDRPLFLRERPPRPIAPPRARPAPEGHVPGETGLWVFILGDMTLFGVFFCAFLVTGHQMPALFAQSRAALDQTIGAVNTLVLITSSVFVAFAMSALRRDRRAQALRCVAVAIGMAIVFAALKVVEYSGEAAAGHGPGENLFFTYYFVLTGIHLLHLVIGATLLTVLWRRIRAATVTRDRMLFAEGAAVYWHMVDLLWIVLFPLLYLVVLT